MYRLCYLRAMKKRIICEVSYRFHDDLKKRAHRNHVTMKTYIITILVEHLRREYETEANENREKGTCGKAP